MELSVLIPTRGRADKLGRCLERLARQSLDASRFEVLIGVDGRDPPPPATSAGPAADAAHELAQRIAGSIRAVVHEFDHAGPAATRNRLAQHARGRVLLLLNDDVLPEPDLLEVHLHEQARLRSAGLTGMVLGDAPWVRPPAAEDTLFDRLVRDTSMIFFYDRMHAAITSGEAGPDHDWGFRHAWTLNLSLPREAFESVGGFDPRLRYACYEDLEFAFRIVRKTGAPVRFAPAAIVHHDHRITPDDYLRRERLMGRAAREFAAAAPECALAVFGRDILSDAELAYARHVIEREASTAALLRNTFTAWTALPATALDATPDPALLLRALYEHHLPLKRYTWRQGLLDQPPDDQ